MFIVFTGNGKGKTSASLGVALRAIGDGKRVLMVQFIKGPWKSGEDTSYQRLAPDFRIVKMGKGFVGILDDTLPFEEHALSAELALAYAADAVESGDWDILILDEVWNALDLKLIDPEVLQAFIDTYMPMVEQFITTGRNCPLEFIDQADLATEMREIKHPFQIGVAGQKGLEY